MIYYKRHIGDYAAKAGHLTALEHGVYCLILDGYYNRERGPTKEEAVRWARARSEDELAAVEAVLAEFFTLDGDRYVQARVEEELASYLKRKETNRLLGAKGGRANAKRIASQSEAKGKRIATQSPSEKEANDKPSHKPLAISQEPIECSAAPAKAATAARTYLGWVKSLPDDQDPLPATDPVFAYAKQVGLSDEFMALAWAWFENTYGPDGPRSSKRYTDWRKVFRNAVEGNWGKLWYVDGDGYRLTTVGLQLQRALRGAG